MRQGAGPQAGAAEALLQGHVGDDTFFAMVTEPIADLADDLTDMDQEETFLVRTGAPGDAGGQELDRSVHEEPTPQAAQGSATARVPGAVLTVRHFLSRRGRAEQSARRTRMLSVHARSCTPRRRMDIPLAHKRDITYSRHRLRRRWICSWERPGADAPQNQPQARALVAA